MPKIIDTVGSSTAIVAMAVGFSASAIVSPIMMSSMPARQMTSPAAASFTSTRFRPSNMNSLVTTVFWTVPSSLHTEIGSVTRTRPLKMRPIASRPR